MKKTLSLAALLAFTFANLVMSAYPLSPVLADGSASGTSTGCSNNVSVSCSCSGQCSCSGGGSDGSAYCQCSDGTSKAGNCQVKDAPAPVAPPEA